ncbi:hypothetical protein COCON_G00188450 [Conger conger]|uniref:Uncharacterized protein n=1 Tax=Conger conger TaxID=82655 RepID=A0A9Q1D3T7_CONCO|nr:hypothetical protein COCON_G00188450 [Conger conger]
MSLIPRTSVFTFQSSVHCLHVLRCLDEQRRTEILCDVTVVVENKSYRAHRSVLAACSDHFRSRLSGHAGQGLVITLPEEVTVEGFEPLLQFAYTAKLLFTRENIVEIHNCAEILGFHNLDKACFDFLLPKFFDHGKTIPRIQRKLCCKTKCCQRKSLQAKSQSGSDGDEQEVDHGDAEPVLSQAGQENGSARSAETQSQNSVSVSESPDACGPSCPDEHAGTGYGLCPKYRKFQMACGKERCCLEDCGPTEAAAPPAQTSELCASPCLPCTSKENNNGAGEPCPRNLPETGGWPENEVTPLVNCLPCTPESSTSTGFLATADLSHVQPAPTPSSDIPDCCPVGPVEGASVVEGDEVELGCGGIEGPVNIDPVDSALPNLVQEGGGDRSSVEREVAEHLAKGFWTDPSPSQAESLLLDPEGQAVLGKAADFHWLKHLDLNASTGDCPFLRDLGEGVQLPEEFRTGAQPEKSPCISSVNSGENSDSDSEGDSESYNSERAREMQLPFPVERISSLSRNDFQHLLRLQSLTREQLDFVHDVRRRSKNRVAAQRCRKRKQECILGLEGEIHKLRGEREQLVEEREQLKRRKVEAMRSLSELCHKVCSEATLSPEQLEFLAQFSSPDCPIHALMSSSPSPDLSLRFSLTLQDQDPTAKSHGPVLSFPDPPRQPWPHPLLNAAPWISTAPPPSLTSA